MTLRALLTARNRHHQFLGFTPFRRCPFWRADDHRYFCIDAIFLTERLSSFGFYWVVINGLVDKTLRAAFQPLWGELNAQFRKFSARRSEPRSTPATLRACAGTTAGAAMWTESVEYLSWTPLRELRGPRRQRRPGRPCGQYGASGTFAGMRFAARTKDVPNPIKSFVR